MGANKWQTSDTWPPEGAQEMTFALSSGGQGQLDFRRRRTRRSAARARTCRTRSPTIPTNPVPSYGGNVCCTGTAIQAGAFDQRKIEARQDILVYTSEPFADGLELSGPITPTLYVSSDAKDTDFTVKVLDVYPDGRAYNLDESIQRMRYRDGYDKPPVVDGARQGLQGHVAAAHDEQLLRAGPPAAHRGLEQQLPALRSQPEHRRQQLR